MAKRKPPASYVLKRGQRQKAQEEQEDTRRGERTEPARLHLQRAPDKTWCGLQRERAVPDIVITLARTLEGTRENDPPHPPSYHPAVATVFPRSQLFPILFFTPSSAASSLSSSGLSTRQFLHSSSKSFDPDPPLSEKVSSFFPLRHTTLCHGPPLLPPWPSNKSNLLPCSRRIIAVSV